MMSIRPVLLTRSKQYCTDWKGGSSLKSYCFYYLYVSISDKTGFVRGCARSVQTALLSVDNSGSMKIPDCRNLHRTALLATVPSGCFLNVYFPFTQPSNVLSSAPIEFTKLLWMVVCAVMYRVKGNQMCRSVVGLLFWEKKKKTFMGSDFECVLPFVCFT